MASASDRATLRTVLRVGSIEIPVGLFSSSAQPEKVREFVKAGPNGGELKQVAVSRASEPEPLADPLSAVLEASIANESGLSATSASPAHFAVVDQVEHGLVETALMEDGSGILVEPDQIRRGVRLPGGRFVDCTDRLAAIETRTRLEGMSVVAFVSLAHVQRSRVKDAKFIGSFEGAQALKLLYEGLRRTRRGAVVKLTKRSRQTLGVIAPAYGTLMLFELVWAQDVREPPKEALALSAAAVTAEQVDRIADLIHLMSDTPALLAELADDAVELRVSLYDEAISGMLPVEAEIIDPVVEQDARLLAELEASLALVGGAR